MNLLLDFGMNAAMVVLLSITIFYCWLLNKRIQVLQDSKSELAKLLKQFDQTTLKATQSIDTLHAASKKISDTMQSRMEKANYLLDDLSFMIDRASKTADQMEAGIAIARQKDKLAKDHAEAAMPPTTMSTMHRAAQATQHATQAAFKKIMPAAASPNIVAAQTSTPESLRDAISMAEVVLGENLLPDELRNPKNSSKSLTANTLSSLQALIEKVAEKRSDPVLRGNQKLSPGMQPSKIRSQSEEELVDALRYNTKV